MDPALERAQAGQRMIAAGEVALGIAALRQALEAKPDSPAFLNELANALLSICQADEAIRTLARAQQLAPSVPSLQSNLLFSLLYSPNVTPALIAAAHRRWGAQFPDAPRPPFSAPGERIRLGYVSGSFCRDPEVFFTAPLLRSHDRRRFEVFCYSNVAVPDDETERIRRLADHWRDIAGMTDEQAAERIRDDRVDILVDCSGHFAGSRLRLFALRPAPTQVGFPAYPATSGLSALDYRLTDDRLDPEGLTDHLYTERLVRLPCPFVSYDAPRRAARPAAPHPDNDFTFGCFNRFHKISEPLVDLWSSVLREAPRTRLLLHSAFRGSPTVSHAFREPILDWFSARGVCAGRIEFQGALPFGEHLRLYNRIDVSLDTYPYHGMTTSCESLWMGAPLVTLAGQACVSRVGVSLLHAAGLTDWVAHSPGEYVEIAAAAARRRSDLGRLRLRLRAVMRRSLVNPGRYTAAVEQAYTNLRLPGAEAHP